MTDFSYSELPEIVTVMNECLKLEDVLKLEEMKKIPQISNRKRLLNYSGEPFKAHTVLFNTEV